MSKFIKQVPAGAESDGYDDDDDGPDNINDFLRQKASEPEVGETSSTAFSSCRSRKRSKGPKKKRRDQSPQTKAYNDFKDKTMMEIEEEIHERELEKGKKLMEIPKDEIVYIDTMDKVYDHVPSLIKDIETEGRDIHPLALDFEGQGATMQIYTVANSKIYALLFQMNKIAPKKKLPAPIFDLFNMDICPIGRDVEKEHLAFLEKYGFSEERLNITYFIDVTDLIHACDVMTRGNPEDALAFAKHGIYNIEENLNLGEGVDIEVLLETGLRIATNYFCGMELHKPTHLVHPSYIDWTLKKKGQEMTPAMKTYAMTDVFAPYHCLSEAATELSLTVDDFIRISCQSSKSQVTGPYVYKGLLKLATAISESECSEAQERDFQKVRDHHLNMIMEESERKAHKHSLWVHRRDIYREEHDMEP